MARVRPDVTVENVLDVKGATETLYNVDIAVDGATVFSKSKITHPWLTRWRKLFNLGVEVSQITPDFEPFYASKALPRYQSIITDSVGSPEGPRFDILQIGALHNPMNDVAWRPEIAPYPDWAARYLVHKNPVQRQFVLANGDLGGSWRVHIREIDGRLVSIDERPNFWLDGRCEKWPDPNSSCPRGDAKTVSPWRADIAHQPSIAYVPYLISGDRYYADEMKFWANYVLIGTWQSLSYDTRRGAQGAA